MLRGNTLEKARRLAVVGLGLLLHLANSDLSAQDRPLDWQFTERLRLGTALGSEYESFHDLTPYSLAADANGYLYVLDRGNARIQVFDADGEFVRTIGHEGGGPGEFQNPVSIWIADEASIAVFDWGPHRVSRFTSDGTLIDDYSVPYSRGQFMYADGTHEVFTRTEGFRPDSLGQSPDSTVQRLYVVMAGDTTELAHVSLVPPERIFFEEPCRFAIDLTPLFEPSIVWDADAGRVAVTASYRYEIDVYDLAGGRFTLSRPIEPRRLTRKDVLKALGDSPYMPNPYGGDCGKFDAEVIVEHRGFYPFEQRIARIQIDPDGGFWVARKVGDGDDRATDIIDASGDYVGTLPADAPFPTAFTPGGDVIVVEEGEFDVQQVVVYSITR